jgi:hypothetical protein
MSPLRLNGSTTGFVSLAAPAIAGSNTLTLPLGGGSADQALVTNGFGTLSWSDRGRMVVGTAQNSTSGTSIDFTGIPSWVKRVTVMFQGVSTSGTSAVDVRLGTSGGIQATGYTNFLAGVSGLNACSTATFTTGCTVIGNLAAATRTGNVVFVSYGSNNFHAHHSRFLNWRSKFWFWLRWFIRSSQPRSDYASERHRHV